MTVQDYKHSRLRLADALRYYNRVATAAPTFRYERSYWDKGVRYIAGLDEVGVGALAGPAVAAVVVFAPGVRVRGIRDSKQLPPRRRRELITYIAAKAVAWAVAEASVAEIATLNIRGAVHLAMRRAIEQLAPTVPELLLVDGFSSEQLHPAIPSVAIIKGDRFSFTIAAASILAKEHRDALMERLDKKFPAYGFAEHKGYPTARHNYALAHFGATPHHRIAYAPVARVLGA